MGDMNSLYYERNDSMEGFEPEEVINPGLKSIDDIVEKANRRYREETIPYVADYYRDPEEDEEERKARESNSTE